MGGTYRAPNALLNASIGFGMAGGTELAAGFGVATLPAMLLRFESAIFECVA